MKLKRRRVSPVLPEHHEAFNRLLEDPVVKRFLAWDKDLRISDNYLLAMVIAYFSRAGLFSWQYQCIHFFLALYLANDMEEDNQAPKQDTFYFLYGKNRSQRLLFHKLRLQFICSMRWRTRVSLGELEEVGGAWEVEEADPPKVLALKQITGADQHQAQPGELWIFSNKFTPMLMADTIKDESSHLCRSTRRTWTVLEGAE
ncbi:speedy protein E4-like [Sapajus apella]|uniref:Speedy protein E4-like n=1 Tax=Sapajus apella TaxID=9515 RepID=A0A6J3HE69_SAPAP|nr:speedy protein E4-like [Sapajus apella]